MCMDGIGCFQSVSVCFSGTVIIIIMQVAWMSLLHANIHYKRSQLRAHFVRSWITFIASHLVCRSHFGLIMPHKYGNSSGDYQPRNHQTGLHIDLCPAKLLSLSQTESCLLSAFRTSHIWLIEKASRPSSLAKASWLMSPFVRPLLLLPARTHIVCRPGHAATPPHSTYPTNHPTPPIYVIDACRTAATKPTTSEWRVWHELKGETKEPERRAPRT